MGTAANTSARIDVRSWPRLPSTAHIVLRDVAMVPTTTDVEHWVDEIFGGSRPVRTRPHAGAPGGSGSVDAIRTGALFPSAAEAFAASGFVEVDRLALLARDFQPTEAPPRRAARAGIRLRPLRTRDLPSAAIIDTESFEVGWQNDPDTLDDIRRATPRARSRRAVAAGRDVGFAITGLAAGTGYLQRIAVSPRARRRGAARLLVDDALRWLIRRGADTALVNTGVDNEPARSLYEGCGFRRRSEDLVVMERRR